MKHKRRRCPKCMRRRIVPSHYKEHLAKCRGTYDKADKAKEAEKK